MSKHFSSQIKISALLASLLIVIPLLASCSLPGGPVVPATQTPAPSEVPPLSPTPQAPTPGPVVNTPEVQVPSATPFPTFTNTPVVAINTPASSGGSSPAAVTAGAISFTPGTTAGVVTGTVQSGQVLNYTVTGAANQAMVLILESNHADVVLGLTAPNGQLLVSSASRFTRWQGILPQSGSYTIQVVGSTVAEAFVLTVKISEVINFAAGTSSITLNGTTTNGFLHSYSFAAMAGQVMTVTLNVPSTTATIDVFGIGTGVLLSPSSHLSSWSGSLPETQVYVIEVIPTGGVVINYSLTVSITGAGQTPIPQPSPQPTSGPSGTLVFPSGTTGTTVSGTVQPYQVVTYTLNAGSNLPVILNLSSAADVYLQFVWPDGEIRLPAANHYKNWQDILYQNGLYRVQVIGGAAASAYSLMVRIPVAINFPTGTTGTTVTNSTVGGQQFSYGLICAANQTMTASLNTPATSAYLDIFGLSTGDIILNASAHATSWTATLPANQYYIIDVNPVNNQVVSFTLTVSCTGATSSSSTPIVFTQGTTAGVATGTIQPGQVISYTVAAQQYQDIRAKVDTTSGDVYLKIFDPNGTPLFGSTEKFNNWQGILPLTGTYTIQLAGGTTTQNFILTVKIPQRVTFAQGQSSITLYGTTVNGYVYSYAFRANAGQTMTVTINQPATVAYIDIYGISTGTLLSFMDKATSWTGTLPAYQDYIIEVVPASGQLMSYTLTVTIH